jgi:hypothetical protein
VSDANTRHTPSFWKNRREQRSGLSTMVEQERLEDGGRNLGAGSAARVWKGRYYYYKRSVQAEEIMVRGLARDEEKEEVPLHRVPKRRKARCTRYKKDDEEQQKNNFSTRSLPRPRPRRPHKSITLVVPAVAHYTYRVTVFEKRVMQRRCWTSP